MGRSVKSAAIHCSIHRRARRLRFAVGLFIRIVTISTTHYFQGTTRFSFHSEFGPLLLSSGVKRLLRSRVRSTTSIESGARITRAKLRKEGSVLFSCIRQA